MTRKKEEKRTNADCTGRAIIEIMKLKGIVIPDVNIRITSKVHGISVAVYRETSSKVATKNNCIFGSN